MSTDKDGTQAWYKHGPVYDADANCDVWGIADVPYERGEEQTMLMWVYSEADADRILADHRKAAKADALAKALVEIGCVSVSDTPCNDRTDGYEGCTRCAALASYASNPATTSEEPEVVK